MRTDRVTKLAIGIIILLIAAFFLVSAAVYVVDQREMAVVLQFGKPVAERREPGVYFKMPLVQEVRKLPSTRQFWGDDAASPLSDLPTKDDKKIEIVPWAIWRVQEPQVFVQTLVTMEEAERRVSEFVRGAVRDVVTQYDLAELVRSTDRPLTTKGTLGVDVQGMDAEEIAQEELKPGEEKQVRLEIEFGRPTILEQIKNEARRRLDSKGEGRQGRGIELIDVGISQIDFVPSVQSKTFDRWIAERQAIAALNINEGERMKQEIVNKARAEVEQIEGEGQQQANEIRGTIDAEIIRKFAQAIARTGEFYTFVRTLEVYKNAIGPDTTLILTTDGELFRMLKRLDPAPDQSPPASVSSTADSPRDNAADRAAEAAR